MLDRRRGFGDLCVLFSVTHPCGDRREELFVVLAYFDESGPQGGAVADVLTVGGFVAEERRWRRIEDLWNGLLGRRVFHMADFQRGVKEFERWPSAKRRKALITSLIDSVFGNVWLGIAHSVRYSEFSVAFCPRATPKKRLRLAYGALLLSCLSDLVNFKATHGDKGLTSVVCEEHDGIEGFATDCFYGFKREYGLNEMLGDLMFYPKGKFRGLQAADLIAYENFRFCRDIFSADDQIPKKPFAALRTRGKLAGGIYEGKALLKFKGQLDALSFWQQLSGEVLAS